MADFQPELGTVCVLRLQRNAPVCQLFCQRVELRPGQQIADNAGVLLLGGSAVVQQIADFRRADPHGGEVGPGYHGDGAFPILISALDGSCAVCAFTFIRLLGTVCRDRIGFSTVVCGVHGLTAVCIITGGCVRAAFHGALRCRAVCGVSGGFIRSIAGGQPCAVLHQHDDRQTGCGGRQLAPRLRLRPGLGRFGHGLHDMVGKIRWQLR